MDRLLEVGKWRTLDLVNLWQRGVGRVIRWLGMVEIKVVAAVDGNMGVGFKNRLPWPRHAEDMANFRDLTMGEPCVMGRRTWLSLPGQKLVGRRMVVVSGTDPDGRVTHATIDQALDIAAYHAKHTVWIIGGPVLWEQCFNRGLVDEVILTQFDKSWPWVDTYFPIEAMFDPLFAKTRHAWHPRVKPLKAGDGNITTFRRL